MLVSVSFSSLTSLFAALALLRLFSLSSVLAFSIRALLHLECWEVVSFSFFLLAIDVFKKSLKKVYSLSVSPLSKAVILFFEAAS